ncbi:hypothetical protein EON79_12010 [bacterium]|nr:MAG: hypothetical protein EON79_12010 [bacterium]
MRRKKAPLFLAAGLLIALAIWVLLPRPATLIRSGISRPGPVASLAVLAVGHRGSVKILKDCKTCHR